MKLTITLVSSLLISVAAMANTNSTTQATPVVPGIKCEGVCEANASSAKIQEPHPDRYNKFLPDGGTGQATDQTEPAQPANESK